LTSTEIENECPESTNFRCGKKCLSKHRLVDNSIDCAGSIDELHRYSDELYDYSNVFYNNGCALNDKYRIPCTFKRGLTNASVCMLRVFLSDIRTIFECNKTVGNLPDFPTLCDGYIEHGKLINGVIETDETNCEEWLCDNQYTRCDRAWNCRNGADEIHCGRLFCNNEDAYPCFLWNSSRPICLPISRADDGIIDCIGATDERYLCRDEDNRKGHQRFAYRCWNNRTRDEQIRNQ
jgi:hypothetical protein